METYIVTIFVKSGHEDEVIDFYQSLEPDMRKAPGFRSRKIYQAKTGTMAEWVRREYTAEELAKHAEPEHEDPGVQVILVEEWDSVDQRMKFSKTQDASRQKAIFPHLLPSHSHEFYADKSVD